MKVKKNKREDDNGEVIIEWLTDYKCSHVFFYYWLTTLADFKQWNGQTKWWKGWWELAWRWDDACISINSNGHQI